MDPVKALLGLVLVLGGRWLVRARVPWRDPVFAVVNVAAVYGLFFWHRYAGYKLALALLFGAYVGLVSTQYLALRVFARRPGAAPWLAFAVPVLALAVLRYVPPERVVGLFSTPLRDTLLGHPELTPGLAFVGISYLAFRTSWLVLEVRNGVVRVPSYAQYLGFAFFAPTLSVGPISPYSTHLRGFSTTSRPDLPVGRALLRMLIGAVKYAFLGPLFERLDYAGFLLDGHPHGFIDLPIAATAYYGFLYCNFSGFCDLAIGVAGLMGIPVAENFANPFGARNVKEFWNRWHITLSQYMRDVVFSPLSKALVRRFGISRTDEAIAVTILVVFLLVGIWHGVGWNYALFGALHGLAMVANHYYTILLKRRLGRAGFTTYAKSPSIQALAVASTFVFVTATIFLFANTPTEMRQIVALLRAQHL